MRNVKLLDAKREWNRWRREKKPLEIRSVGEKVLGTVAFIENTCEERKQDGAKLDYNQN